MRSLTIFRSIITISCFLHINLFSQNVFIDKEYVDIILYKKNWFRKELNNPADTTKKIIVFNDYFNVNQWIFSTKKIGESIRTKFSYTDDSISYTVIDKKNTLVHIVVFDSLYKIKQEGNLKGIGPFSISQKVVKSETSYYFEYIFYYYLVKIGKWSVYDEKSKKEDSLNIELPDKFKLDKLVSDNINAVKKRRKVYLKTHKLKNDYYE